MNPLFQGLCVALSCILASNQAFASGCDAEIDQPVSELSDTAPLTLTDVIAQVRTLSPAALAAKLEARALNAEAEQAGRKLNPIISLEVENFGGQGATQAFDQAETSLMLEQTFRLGDKRRLGQRAARARAALQSAECLVMLREIELEAGLLFAELAGTIELRDLAAENAELTSQLADTVKRRLDAGAAAPPELSRAKTDAALARAELANAEEQVIARRYELAALWGDSDPRFANPQNLTLAEAPETPSSEHPRLIAANAELSRRQAESDLSKTAALPNVTISAGIRRFEDTGDSALIAGVSVPLPVFDKGQDQARASQFRSDAAQLSHSATEQQLLSEQRSAIASLKAAESQLSILRDEALPEAESAYDAALRGYEIGRFDLTSTLNARSALNNVRLSVIQAELTRNSYDLKLRSLVSAAPFDGGVQ
ncbi:MAG: transporter [Ponticaulis sp.]|nr:transporter [Ponticaulis sp.]